MSVDTTPSIPDSFCPGKWDELCLNLNYNYVYSCCSAVPMTFVKDFNEVLDKQKANLLNGVKDTSCNHCWDIERSGGTSKRPKYFKNFDSKDFVSYQNGTSQVKSLELNLGNECNFQCVYCNPKYSSLWEADVAKQPYKVFADRFNYNIIEKNKVDLTEVNCEQVASVGHVSEFKLIGGEPLQNKHVWEVLESASADRLTITTNLSCKQSSIDRLLALANTQFKSIRFQISLDATKEISEFVRYGMEYDATVKNIEYVLLNAPPNVLVTIASTISSLTVRDLPNFTKQIEHWQTIRPSLIWTLNYCSTPVIQSFVTLPEVFKNSVQEQIDYIKTMPNIEFPETIESALQTTYSPTMYKELQYFMQQFADRKNIKIPLCLE